MDAKNLRIMVGTRLGKHYDTKAEVSQGGRNITYMSGDNITGIK